MKRLALLFAFPLLWSACGSGGAEQSTDSDSTATDAQPQAAAPAATEEVPTVFTMNPSDTYEDFAYIVAGERFPEDDLGYVAEWPQADEELSAVFFTLVSAPEWYVLVPTATDFEYQLQEVVLPQDSPWRAYGPTVTTDFYQMELALVDEMTDTEDFVVATQIAGVGPAPDGDGMVPLNFIRAAVLRLEEGKVKYMPQLSQGYNGYIGATEVGVNLDPLALLAIKYQDLTGALLEYPETRQITNLLIDMDLAPNYEPQQGNELEQMAATVEGGYVRTYSEETAYFVEDRSNNFWELEECPYSLYPVYLQTGEYATYRYQVAGAKVDDDVVKFSLLGLDESYELNGEELELIATYEDEAWVVTQPSGLSWMRMADAKDLPMTEGEY